MPPDLASLLLTRGLFFDESSEGELCFRGAFIFAILVALLRACKQSSDRALARRVLSGFEHLRKAFKKLSVPHTRSIQAQILNPESLTPSKSPMWTFPISRRLTGHQRRFGIRMQSVFTRIPQMMRLKKISLLRERITKPREYPFNIPTIASLNALEISSRVCFFVGENGTGKSTLLEAIAAHYGFGLEGGNRNFSPKTTDSVTTIEPLVRALRLSFAKRTGGGFYLRAKSFFNVASYVDQVGASGSYGDKSLHDQSHGESFLSLLQNRFTRSGFYLIDEPEAALSPQRQLSFLLLLHDLVKGNDNIQFIIATHSPILLAYPEAQIFSFDKAKVHQIDYRESQPFQLVSRFIALLSVI